MKSGKWPQALEAWSVETKHSCCVSKGVTIWRGDRKKGQRQQCKWASSSQNWINHCDQRWQTHLRRRRSSCCWQKLKRYCNEFTKDSLFSSSQLLDWLLVSSILLWNFDWRGLKARTLSNSLFNYNKLSISRRRQISTVSIHFKWHNWPTVEGLICLFLNDFNSSKHPIDVPHSPLSMSTLYTNVWSRTYVILFFICTSLWCFFHLGTFSEKWLACWNCSVSDVTAVKLKSIRQNKPLNI